MKGIKLDPSLQFGNSKTIEPVIATSVNLSVKTRNILKTNHVNMSKLTRLLTNQFVELEGLT